MKLIFQNTHQNNRLRVKNCSHVLQFKVLWDYDSTIIKRSRRSGFITSLQKFWTVFHFFLVYSTSRFIETFSEVTDSGSDTTSQQSNFFEISILLEVSGRWYFCKDLTSLGSVCSITNLSGIPFCSPPVQDVVARVCEWTFNSSVFAQPFTRLPQHVVAYWTISKPNCKMYKKILWDHFYDLTHIICCFL